MYNVITSIQYWCRSLRWCNDARQTNRIHRNQEELKLSLFADDVISYRENPKDLTTKLVSNLNKVTEHKSFNKNQSYFYMLVMNICNLKLYLSHPKTNRWKIENNDNFLNIKDCLLIVRHMENLHGLPSSFKKLSMFHPGTANWYKGIWTKRRKIPQSFAKP